MVSSYGVIEGGVVVNAVLAEEDFALEQGWVLLPEGVGPTWLYNGSTFSEPLPYVPIREEQEAKRSTAYRNEADPLFFMAQRGKATQQEWLDKIAEIEARFPYPEV
jgi:hypothetical protein